MRLYYNHAGVQIWLGDCRRIAPLLRHPWCATCGDPLVDAQILAIHLAAQHTVEAPPEIAAVVSDPPYGINLDCDYSRFTGGRTVWPQIVGDDAPFDPAPWLGYERVVLFGANHYANQLPPSQTWVVWDKRCGTGSNDFADCELAWVKGGPKSNAGPARVLQHMWNGYSKQSERNTGPRVHPTQKPVAVMEWVIARYCQPTDVILDPYMGSGTTLVAARRCGHRAIGIEIEEQYCEAAVRRLAQEQLFPAEAAAPAPEQLALP